MLYTVLTKMAMKIAFLAHMNQVDKSGVPYIYHPIHLAEQMEDEETICVALLHDVVEDTDITLEQLAAVGFPDSIIEALRLLTHDPAVPYMDYVREIKKNIVATRVKRADLEHNSDIRRLGGFGEVDEKDLARVRKYREAIELLMEDGFRYYRYGSGKIVRRDESGMVYSQNENGVWELDGHALAQFYDAAMGCEEISKPPFA